MKTNKIMVSLLMVVGLLLMPAELIAQHDTIRVSVSSTGEEANGESEGYSSISSDGRFITFRSKATNLVPDAIGGIFVHDQETNQTSCMSVDPAGEPVSGYHGYPAILLSPTMAAMWFSLRVLPAWWPTIPMEKMTFSSATGKPNRPFL